MKVTPALISEESRLSRLLTQTLLTGLGAGASEPRTLFLTWAPKSSVCASGLDIQSHRESGAQPAYS